MVVCICKSISEKDIIAAILGGCESFEQLIEEKDITTDCTTCFDAARSFFEDKKNILDD
jgi:bacterioferritin-associated ferredoxin